MIFLQFIMFAAFISTQADAATIGLDQFPPDNPALIVEMGDNANSVFLRSYIGAQNSFEYTNPIKQMLERLSLPDLPHDNMTKIFSIESQKALMRVLSELTRKALINRALAIRSLSTRNNAYLLGPDSYLNFLADPIATSVSNEFENIFLLHAQKLLKSAELYIFGKSAVQTVIDTLAEVALMYETPPSRIASSTDHIIEAVGTLARIARIDAQSEVGQMAIQALKTIVIKSTEGNIVLSRDGTANHQRTPWNFAADALVALALEKQGRETGILCADILLGVKNIQ